MGDLPKTARRKVSIRRKFTFIIFSSTIIAIALGLLISYFFAFNTLRDSLGKEYLQMSEMLASFVKEAFRDEVENVMSYTARTTWVEAIERSGAKSSGMTAEERKTRPYEPDTTVSAAMRDLLTIRRTMQDIMITDKFGRVVASSGKPSSSYQGDEEWWKYTYNKGKSRAYIGDIETASGSAGELVIPIAIPILDKEGAFVGALREFVSIDRLFGKLKEFRIGNTGHAVLVDRNGYILFHYNIPPMRAKFNYENFDRLSRGGKLYNEIVNPYTRKTKIFMAFTKVDLPVLRDRGIYWRIFIDQDAAETFAPLNKFVFDIVIVMLGVIVVMIPIGYMLSGIYASPIRKLQAVTEKVMKGDWDYKISIRTGDEIEEFADSFGSMVSALKDKQGELTEAKESMEELAKSLDKKVTLRTKDLRVAQQKMLTMLSDLTDAKHSLERETKELEKALKIKSSFISTVSHELRTPLAAIKESIAIVLDGVTGPATEAQAEFLDMAKRNVDRLARLINDILDFQKLESGKMTFAMQKHDINEIATEVGNTMASLARQKDLSFTLDLEENIPQVTLDKDKIIQILTNLVSNAIKFTDKGGITIKTANRSNGVLVSVYDTGIGIKEENIPRLFREFEQLANGQDRETGGTGLGLAISKKMVEGHEGRIWATSEYGKGSTFVFFLPFA